MDTPKDKLVQMFETMVTIRHFEEGVAKLMRDGKIPGLAHLYVGQEAVAVGVCSLLANDDYIASSPRGHGHLIAKGGDPKGMYSELLGRTPGYCHGKGGSMHIADLDLGMLGANGIVGAQAPIAGGPAFAARYKGTDAVSICFFGDGATNQGAIHEAMNLAASSSCRSSSSARINSAGEWS